MVRLLIGDRQEMFRQGLRRLLADSGEFSVAAEAVDDVGVLSALDKCRIDVAVLAQSLPQRGGIPVIRDVKARQPATRVLILAVGVRDPYLLPALHAGAHGYITKENSAEELCTALRRLAGGRRYICPAVAERQTFDFVDRDAGQPDHMRLSMREFEIFRLLVSGRRSADIAYELSLSEKTISTHKANVLKKLNLRSVAELVRYAVQHDLVAI